MSDARSILESIDMHQQAAEIQRHHDEVQRRAATKKHRAILRAIMRNDAMQATYAARLGDRTYKCCNGQLCEVTRGPGRNTYSARGTSAVGCEKNVACSIPTFIDYLNAELARLLGDGESTHFVTLEGMLNNYPAVFCRRFSLGTAASVSAELGDISRLNQGWIQFHLTICALE